MLIICSGPDTWHAQKKAQSLVEAFHTKHDPQGFSTETLASVDLKSLLNQLAAPSLFVKKRMIRCDGLFYKMKIADVRTLAKRLENDADQTVLLVLEEEPPTAKILGEFLKIKLVHYEYPVLRGIAFRMWCTKRASELGVRASTAVEIARRMDGDIWRAEQEFEKFSANPQAPMISGETDKGSVFDLADAFLTDRVGWRSLLASTHESQAISVFVSQARSAVRVMDGETTGIHPYVVKKLRQSRITSPLRKFMRTLCVLVASRQGFVDPKEGQTIL